MSGIVCSEAQRVVGVRNLAWTRGLWVGSTRLGGMTWGVPSARSWNRHRSAVGSCPGSTIRWWWSQNRHKVPQGCHYTCPPRFPMVGVAGAGRLVAARKHTATVAEFQRGPDCGGHEALGAAHVQDLRRPTQHGGHDVGVTQPSAVQVTANGERRTANMVKSGQAKVALRTSVEVFRMESVRTPIIGRPRPLPDDRRASHRYTLNREEQL